MAHNTVTVNKENSSDIWDCFRVGQRAMVTVIKDSEKKYIAEHDGYKKYNIIHRRKWNFEEKSIIVVDRIIGNSMLAESYIHFDYTLMPELYENKLFLDFARLSFNGAEKIMLIPYLQSLGFNKVEKAYCVVIQFYIMLETVITFI
jgi:uncharacterized protein Usg